MTEGDADEAFAAAGTEEPPTVARKDGRYQVREGSQSAHCCFRATVVDMAKPEIINGKHYHSGGEPQYEPICECFDEGEAVMIADALNRGWLPIDIAPKDGTHILAWLPENEGPDEFDKNQPAPWIVLRWDGRNWIEPHYDAFTYFPTKWMPLPEPPK